MLGYHTRSWSFSFRPYIVSPSPSPFSSLTSTSSPSTLPSPSPSPSPSSLYDVGTFAVLPFFLSPFFFPSLCHFMFLPSFLPSVRHSESSLSPFPPLNPLPHTNSLLVGLSACLPEIGRLEDWEKWKIGGLGARWSRMGFEAGEGILRGETGGGRDTPALMLIEWEGRYVRYDTLNPYELGRRDRSGHSSLSDPEIETRPRGSTATSSCCEGSMAESLREMDLS